MEYQPEENAFVFEMTPSKPEEKADITGELILTPSPADEKPKGLSFDLEAERIFKAEEITFEGEEELENRIEEAMVAYDYAMDQAAGLNK